MSVWLRLAERSTETEDPNRAKDLNVRLLPSARSPLHEQTLPFATKSPKMDVSLPTLTCLMTLKEFTEPKKDIPSTESAEPSLINARADRPLPIEQKPVEDASPPNFAPSPTERLEPSTVAPTIEVGP